MLFRYRRDRRQVKTDALDTRMFLGDFDTEQSSCAADIAQAAIAGEIEFDGERFEVDARRACHSVEKALELFRVGIQFIEYIFAAVLGFVLRFPRAQSFGQIIPVREQPRIVHFRDSADVARAAAVEIQSGGGRIKIFASAPSPSRSRNFIATSASRKSATPRECNSSSLPISVPVNRC